MNPDAIEAAAAAEAAALRKAKKLRELDDFLARCKPTPLPKEEELRRVRLQIAALSERITAAAEERYPGISHMFEWLADKEARLAREAAEEPLVGDL